MMTTERECQPFLNPPPTPKTPEHLLTPTRCRVLRPFMVKLQRVEVGEIVTLPRHEAVYLAGVKKVEVLP
jgi:hypothetical protein